MYQIADLSAFSNKKYNSFFKSDYDINSYTAKYYQLIATIHRIKYRKYINIDPTDAVLFYKTAEREFLKVQNHPDYLTG